ncbi:MAG: GGDEF domain-containing protein, partial [Thermodesulfobacteriota bacterium]
MKQTFNKMSGIMAACFSMIFNTAQNQVDHKNLTHHIIALNKKHSSAQIINEVAVCLKEIFNYRLFAFVIKKEDGVDVWLDPKMYKKSLEKILSKDFSINNRNSLNYLNHNLHADEHKEQFNMKSLVFYELNEENCYSRVYMLPDKNNSCHDKLVNLVLKGGSSALSRQIKIDNLKNRAVIDPLTGCYNRREFTSLLKRNIAGAIRHKTDLSLFMFDLDDFKKVNDTYGHQAGDKVLQEISSLVKKNMRTNDIFVRYGGEEFIAILPETNKIKAMELAERLRSKIAKKVTTYNDDTIKITASFGVAQMDHRADMGKIIQDVDTM